ncbi:MAG: hypothetical protein JKX81_07885 [Arenicella sp.]|nr:hypothetical protein [Arenicella sp.]
MFEFNHLRMENNEIKIEGRDPIKQLHGGAVKELSDATPYVHIGIGVWC